MTIDFSYHEADACISSGAKHKLTIKILQQGSTESGDFLGRCITPSSDSVSFYHHNAILVCDSSPRNIMTCMLVCIIPQMVESFDRQFSTCP
jgi:hypothetical protein